MIEEIDDLNVDVENSTEKEGSSSLRDAAILLMSLGQEVTVEAFQSLGPKEVERLGFEMTQVANINKEEVMRVLRKFKEQAMSHTSLGLENSEYIRSALINALGPEKAESILDKILLSANTKGLETLRWLGPKAVADMIKNEHPQIMALVIDYLEGQEASEVLMELPERLQGDVIERIANLDTINPNALIELNSVLEDQLSAGSAGKSKSAGGVKAAANILNFIDQKNEKRIFEELSVSDPDLAEKVKELMFVFEDLVGLDNKAIQLINKNIPDRNIIIKALKGASEDIKNKFFSNMTKKQAKEIQEDIEDLGPIKMQEIEDAQKQVLVVARKLEEEDKIILSKEIM